MPLVFCLGGQPAHGAEPAAVYRRLESPQEIAAFERTKEHGWRPAYALFFHKERLKIGAWDDNPPVPGVTLERGRWYRIRFDATLSHGGARTVLSVWPVDDNARLGPPQVYGLVIEHKKGLVHPGLARSFPAIAGSYTWGVKGREPYSAATLIAAFGQDTDLER